MQSKYDSIKNAYKTYGVIMGGLGETTLSKPKCFCTDLSNVLPSSIIEKINSKNEKVRGWCQDRQLCNKCYDELNKYCIQKIIT